MRKDYNDLSEEERGLFAQAVRARRAAVLAAAAPVTVVLARCGPPDTNTVLHGIAR